MSFDFISIDHVTICFQDVIDIVKDQPYGADYVKEEDPKLFVSEKTGRGPLEETWLDDYWADVEVLQLLLIS